MVSNSQSHLIAESAGWRIRMAFTTTPGPSPLTKLEGSRPERNLLARSSGSPGPSPERERGFVRFLRASQHGSRSHINIGRVCDFLHLSLDLCFSFGELLRR